MILPKLEGYVIYDPVSGLFSKGGTISYWQKKGKIWASMSAVHCHLAQYIKDIYIYKDNKVTRLEYQNRYEAKFAFVVNVATGESMGSVEGIINELIVRRIKKDARKKNVR